MVVEKVSCEKGHLKGITQLTFGNSIFLTQIQFPPDSHTTSKSGNHTNQIDHI